MPVRAPTDGSVVFESGGYTYLVASLSPAQPNQQEVEEYAYGRSAIDEARRQAPNPHIAWYGGHYVEADHPNRNGTMWRAKEIAIKSLTPMLMPVTVMHDPRTAVGLIADLALRTPDKDGVSRAKIETALALWKHRFPEVVEEAQHNYAEGTLMQSMECRFTEEECASCGQVYAVLPENAQREHWCAHLRGEGDEHGGRILRNVIFTGTGLIFGTRGGEGADRSAYLESFRDEVADFHQNAHTHAPAPKPTRRLSTMEIEQSEWDRVKQERDDERAARIAAEERASVAETAAETAEAEKAAEKERADAAEAEKQRLEEVSAKETLRSERLETFGTAFAEKVGSMPTLKTRLEEQAGTLSDEDWSSRLSEVEEMIGVKRDAAKEGGANPPADPPAGGGADSALFTAEELARSNVGGGADTAGGGVGGQHPAARQSVVRGLMKVTG